LWALYGTNGGRIGRFQITIAVLAVIPIVSKTAFLFPGQGAQTVGMGQQLAQSLPAVRRLYDDAAQILGYDLAEICFDGSADRLSSTVYSQPAILVTSLAALESMKATGHEALENCEVAAGLSLGEYTALAMAGAIDFPSALKLVQKRGEAMQSASNRMPSSMVSLLGLDVAQVEQLCSQARGEDVLQIANYLCPGNIVVSGTQAACDRVAELATEAGAMKTISLAVAGAFHTPIMQPAVEQLAAALDGVEISRPRFPVVSNVDGECHEDPDEIRSMLIRQIVEPVRWEASMRLLLDQGFESFYEVGPGRVLRGLLRRIERKVSCENVMA